MSAFTRFVSRRRWWLLALLLLAIGVGSWAALRKPVNPEDRWRTVTVERGSIRQVVAATGTLQPISQVNVGTQVSGTVARVFVDFNQSVKAGQVLAEMDPALFRSAVKQAEASVASATAQLALARSTEERNRSLVQQQFIAQQALEASTQQREAALAGLQLARAQLERAQTDLANSVIRAPVDGVVVDRKVDVGQTVAASFQTPNLFVIARDLSRMEIHTSVSEADVGNIREAMPVQFRVDAQVDKRFDGKVRQIRLNPKSEQGVVTYNVVIDADNAERLLLPGMTARVDIVAAQKDDVLRVPNAALRFRPTEPLDGKKADDARRDEVKKAIEADRTPRVYRLRDGQVAPVEVKPGISDGRVSEVAPVGSPAGGPLAEGDRLVVRDMKARQAGDMQFSF
ncbi:MAG: efflux RND transporter periplasmic adaptor subunit [Burkholderiaceae bacterium]|jgi:HlyD family secretion protein|nr:efflux RND transporter periplasmic adaptor subunit [Burkholderiaceae bacterium]